MVKKQFRLLNSSVRKEKIANAKVLLFFFVELIYIFRLQININGYKYASYGWIYCYKIITNRNEK